MAFSKGETGSAIVAMAGRGIALPLLFWQSPDGSSLFSILPLILLLFGVSGLYWARGRQSAGEWKRGGSGGQEGARERMDGRSVPDIKIPAIPLQNFH